MVIGLIYAPVICKFISNKTIRLDELFLKPSAVEKTKILFLCLCVLAWMLMWQGMPFNTKW